jgi:thymidine kinase
MFSGKSSELVRRTKRLDMINQSYTIYNSTVDTRYGHMGIYTHNKTRLPCYMVDTLLEQVDTEPFKTSSTLFIDEAQFFHDIVEFVKVAVEEHQKHVVVIGLDGDSDRHNFGEIHKLIPLCDNIVKLKALCSVCKDGTAGIFSKKTSNSSQVVDVGSADKYMAVCRTCYLK